MNVSRLSPLLLSLLLQFAPICKFFQSTSPLASAPIAIIFQWVVGATVAAGTYDAVSGASVAIKILSPTTAKGTNGVPFRYLITQSSRDWDTGHSFEAEPLPVGLSVKTVETVGLPAYGIISGTPLESGVFQVTLRAKFQNDHHPNEAVPTTNLTLTIIGPPSISAQPGDTAAAVGESASFTVTASAFPAPTYTWRRGDTVLATQTGPVLTLNPVTPGDVGEYTVVVQNEFGSVTSSPPARLLLNSTEKPAVIVAEPIPATVLVGTSWTVSVSVTGTEPITYSWFKDGALIEGANGPSVTLPETKGADAGMYHVVVGNALRTGVTSLPAFLRVIPAPNLFSTELAAGQMKFSFHTEAGATYQVQYTDSLVTPQWTNLGDPVTPTVGGHTTISDPAPVANRFYRILATVP